MVVNTTIAQCYMMSLLFFMLTCKNLSSVLSHPKYRSISSNFCLLTVFDAAVFKSKLVLEFMDRISDEYVVIKTRYQLLLCFFSVSVFFAP